MNKKDKKLVRFQDWFNPYDPQHIKWARQYLCYEPEDGIIPDDVVLPNHYGIEMNIKNAFASCWILFKLEGVKDKPVTH